MREEELTSLPDGQKSEIGVAGSQSRDPLYVTSLEKGIRVLEAFHEQERDLSLTEIARLSGLGKSAAQRFCHTLTKLGLLEKDPRTRYFRQTPQLLDFAFNYLSVDPLVAVAGPHTLRAREACGEAVNLARPCGHDVIYVLRLPSLGATLTSPLVGGRAPMFCTSSGRAFLSMLDPDEVERRLDAAPLTPLTPKTVTDRAVIRSRIEEVREHGFTVAEQECFPREIAVGAPISGRENRPLGALNICVTMPTWSVEAVRKKLAPVVCQAAQEISQAMGMTR